MKNILFVKVPGWLEVVFSQCEDESIMVCRQGGWGRCGYGCKYSSLDAAIEAQLTQIALECGQVWADNARRLFVSGKLRLTIEATEEAIFQDMMTHHDSVCKFPNYIKRVNKENAEADRKWNECRDSYRNLNNAEKMARAELEEAAPIHR